MRVAGNKRDEHVAVRLRIVSIRGGIGIESCGDDLAGLAAALGDALHRGHHLAHDATAAARHLGEERRLAAGDVSDALRAVFRAADKDGNGKLDLQEFKELLRGMDSQLRSVLLPFQRITISLGKAVRLGGMVADKSIRHDPDGVTIHFVVEDGKAKVPVTFKGIAPDLFKEKSGVVAEGEFHSDGTFVANNLLAKHDERYMPPELAGKMHKTDTLKP